MTVELTRKEGGGFVLEPGLYIYMSVSPFESHNSGFYFTKVSTSCITKKHDSIH